ncbi:recombinase family protein [Candidatus Methylacidithermus pantelleriae]|uniref:Uncharacterized protein n=1 Tax=Candidatus Methylacidithermus pantelleriae TaxID=2744239 RepID=A0A8J2BRY6_9BACT|nr:hypothetical protein [Candidatus Methylacidithermus pantelleriae]CAF0702655.1 hypothetical protein MPNT_50147 [Candidatus Methylacidithermus pantelleriae]
MTEHADGGNRRYDLAKAPAGTLPGRNLELTAAPLLVPAVFGHDQEKGLERWKEVLELDCVWQGRTFEVISDLRPRMNDRKKGRKKVTKRLLDGILSGQVPRLVRSPIRRGSSASERVFALC